MTLKKGFTLFEVLCALAVVGLISVLVIPILFNTVGNKVYGTQLKKTCSLITDAVQSIITDERSNDTITTEFSEEATDTERGFYYTSAGVKTSNEKQGAQYFLNNYFRHSKVNCGTGGTKACVGEKYRTPKKVNLGTIPSKFYCIKTNNDAAICMYYDPTAKVTEVIVDANGAKSPNITGVDTFVMYITNDGFLKDLDDETSHCNMHREKGKTVVDYAAGCFTKTVNNGWKISND
ncbi:MAG TPA: hypothetical protein DEO94_00635 [Cyanobacteria bacterium UBA11991]|nr:hypothetical protein [Cyanobacteria bacterium UBA11991]